MRAGVAERRGLGNISGMFEVKTPKPPAILIDGVDSNRDYPETFAIPILPERMSVQVGDCVKIGVESPATGHEKFWVQIVARIDNGNYVGRVDNDLADGWGFNYNDQIVFEPRHVLATQ
jgi:hypothetical protein